MQERVGDCMKKALIIVDLQNDFCEGGVLPVPGGGSIVQGINAIMDEYDAVLTTQDYHPADHTSFASNNPGVKPYDVLLVAGREQTMWPDHCVQGSPGAEHHPMLKMEKVRCNFRKGMDRMADSYSGFCDSNNMTTWLASFLANNGIGEVHICGLATEYCVKATAIDAAAMWELKTVVIKDLCRGIALRPGDEEEAYLEMSQHGVLFK